MTSAPPQRVNYLCDQGREFSITYPVPEDKIGIEVAGMHFTLDTDSKAGGRERYSCSALTLVRDGQTARLEIDGREVYENCREQRPAAPR